AALDLGAHARAARLLPDDPDDLAALRLRARLRRAVGDSVRAAADFAGAASRAEALTPAEACDLEIEAAEASLAAGRLADARGALERAAPALAGRLHPADAVPPPGPMEELRGPLLAWPGDDARRVAAWLSARGDLARAEGELPAAAHCHLGALKLAARLRDGALHGRALHALGTAYLRAGRSEAAERWFLRALPVRAEAGDAKGLADTANNLGVLYRTSGRTAEAVEQFTRSLRLRRRLGNAADESASYLNLANVYYERRELEPAIRYWRRALQISRRLGDAQAEARILNNLGAAAFLRRSFEEALRCFRDAEALARRAGHVADALERRLNAADVLAALGARERALRTIRTAARAAEARGLGEIAARARLVTARVRLAEGRHAEALSELAAAEASPDAGPSLKEDVRLEAAAAELALGAPERAEAWLDLAEPGLLAPEARLWATALRVRLAEREGADAVRAALPGLAAAAREAARLRLPWTVFETERAHGRAWRFVGEPGRARAAYCAAFEALEGVLRGVADERLLDAFVRSRPVRGFAEELESFGEEAAREREALPAEAARELCRRAKDALFDAERALAGADSARAGGEAVRRTLEVTRALSSTRPLDDLLRDLVDAAADFSGAERGFVVLVDERGRIRIPVARDRAREAVHDPLRQVSRRVVDDALRRNAPVRYDNAMSDGALASAASVINLELRSVMCAPLSRGGAPFGLLYVDHRSRVARFGDADVEMLGLFAMQAAVALENARLVREHVRDEKLKLLGNLAGGVAHDFNNLLTAILGSVQSVTPRSGEAALDAALRTIEKAARDGAAYVRRLQSSSRTNREDAFGAVDLRELAEDVAAFTRGARDRAALQGRKPTTVELEVPAGLYALGDAVDLRDVFVNVALNAIAAMPDGGRLRLFGGRDGGRVYLETADDGVGMSEEVRENLFDPYFTTRGADGMGLGMSIVLGIVARHQGTIKVESAPGQGTRVRVELPAASAPAPAPEAAPSPAAAESELAARRVGRRVLVVEDDPAVRRVLCDAVRTAGYRVAEAPDGPEALRRLADARFDLVMTDLGMVPMNGWDVAQAVKAEDPTTTVYLVTGWGAEIDQETARRHGVDALVRKPFDVTALARLVDDGVARTERLRAAATS
ncbi:MAG TPA: ATP-binding protein, partial [Planctomycetota bacterium]|nr:ATP-binding protein [Planctomycetota bacterium]